MVSCVPVFLSQEIIDNVFTLVFAATDTTASIFDAVWTMPSGFQ